MAAVRVYATSVGPLVGILVPGYFRAEILKSIIVCFGGGAGPYGRPEDRVAYIASGSTKFLVHLLVRN